MYYTMKQKIHPTKAQIAFFERCIDNQRFYYNQGLSLWTRLYEAGETKLSGRKIRNELHTRIKNNTLCDKDGVVYEDLSFLDSPANILDSACEHLDRAWKNFFRKGIKEGYAKNRPIYKCRKTASKSFTIGKKNDGTFKYDENTFSFTKCPGAIRIKEALRFIDIFDDIKTISISNDSYGWYISITYTLTSNPFNTHQKPFDKVGVDLGIKDFAVLSAVDDTNTPIKVNIDKKVKGKLLKLSIHLKRMQRVLAKKRLSNPEWKLSKRYELLKTKIAHTYQQIAYIKKEFLHTLTYDLTETFNHICIEDLQVKNMLKNRKLSRMIHESLWSTFRVLLEYKALRKNVSITLADKFFPSSKTCSGCGNKKLDLTLSMRVYKCVSCNLSIDRDYNAALNLENLIST